jgi:hypothetical protein
MPELGTPARHLFLRPILSSSPLWSLRPLLSPSPSSTPTSSTRPSRVFMSTDRTNALAGPSTVPNLFLQPASRPSSDAAFASARLTTSSAHAQSRTQLASTQDLISRFRLLSAYDTHVRPYIDLLAGADDAPAPPTPLLSTPASRPFTDKGKGKEREQSDPFPGVGHAPTPGGSGPDGGDEDGKGEKKKKNNYRHLIKGVPGTHTSI